MQACFSAVYLQFAQFTHAGVTGRHLRVRSWKGLPKCAANVQVDNHIAELTVRETLDFAARVLGVGHKEGAQAC